MYRSISLERTRSTPAPPPPKSQWQLLFELTLPVLITNLCQALLPLISYAYAGRLTDATSLAGLGLGVSVCNITGVCIYYGMGTGIELLCAQAFGAKNNSLVGIVFARGTLLTALWFLPVGLTWFFLEWILLGLGLQEEVAHITGTFARAYLWGMIPYAVFENLKRCLQAQSVVVEVMLVAVLGVLANIVFHYITMVFLGMDVYGAGLALSFTGIFLLATLIAFTWKFQLGGEGCWSGLFSAEVREGLLEYLKICIPGLTGVFIEWTSIEASVFLAGLLGEQQLATQVMILSAYGIVFQFALSINIGANIRVGTLLGEGNPEGARKAASCGVRLAVVAAALAALGLGFGRGQWPRLYGVSDDVLDMIVELAPIYVAAQAIDMVQMVCNGILKGMGEQNIQAIAAGVGFWVVGVPLSYFLGLQRGFGLRGLWAGMAIAEGPLLLFYLWFLRSADWNKCAVNAAQRVAQQSDFAKLEPARGDPSASDSDSERSTDCTHSDCESEDDEEAGGAVLPEVNPVGEKTKLVR